jgi:GNAT superfamily N-acetyltransferase
MIVGSLSPTEAMAQVPALAAVLVDCVAGGASVSFMAGYSKPEAEAFYRGCAEGAARGERVILAAFDGETIVGTAQVILAMPPNQPHRGEVAKMLVHRSARGRGAGAALLAACEREAARHGKTLLVLDTVPGMAGERLYDRGGWTRVGVIPDFALMPDGTPCPTMFFYKRISPA